MAVQTVLLDDEMFIMMNFHDSDEEHLVVLIVGLVGLSSHGHRTGGHTIEKKVGFSKKMINFCFVFRPN